jgi:hypothetical protein
LVVLNAASLPAAVMQDVTREVRQFETAFLNDVDLTGGSARLRIFTEDEELDFAGHPVLGAAAVLHTLLPVSGAEQTWALAVAQRTVAARTRGAAGWIDATMDQGVPHVGPAIAGKPGRAYSDALNLAPGHLHPALPMQVVSTGLPYLIVPVQDGLERARISHPRFEELLAASGAKFAYVLDDLPQAVPRSGMGALIAAQGGRGCGGGHEPGWCRYPLQPAGADEAPGIRQQIPVPPGALPGSADDDDAVRAGPGHDLQAREPGLARAAPPARPRSASLLAEGQPAGEEGTSVCTLEPA